MIKNTKVMEALESHLVEKGLAKGTINLYMTKLIKLNGNKPFTSLVFLKDYKRIKAQLDTMENANTRKSYITAVVSVLNNVGKDKSYMERNIMYKSLLEKEKLDKLKENPNEKTTAQKENWIEWTDVQKMQREMEAQTLTIMKDDNPPKPSEVKTMNDYLLLSLYTLTPPRRNLDYLLLKLDSDGKKEDEAVNYYDPKQKTFTFNVFKTKWKNGKETIPCPLPLCKVLDKYVAYNGIGDNEFILFKGDEKRNGGMITKSLNRIFKKKVGASMLRHFYDTHKYGAVLKEMKNDAMMMSHSLAEQKNYVKFDEAAEEK
jgi:hypothetical protein